MKKQDNMKILLVCDNRADVVNIRAKVDSHENIACYVWQCPTLSEGIGYLNIKKLRADMIILDLGLSGEDTPEEIYRQMGVAALGYFQSLSLPEKAMRNMIWRLL